jgi:hypothetical protein
MSNPAWDSLRKVEVFAAAASVAPPSLRRAVEMALKEDNYEKTKKGPMKFGLVGCSGFALQFFSLRCENKTKRDLFRMCFASFGPSNFSLQMKANKKGHLFSLRFA